MAEVLSLSEKAYTEIRRKIIYGDYLPGDVLSENTLSAELKMSRTPIRDALNRLTSVGFVVTLKNRGVLVKEISYKEAFDVQTMIQWMQVYSAELAEKGIITFDLETLKVHLDNQFKAQKNDDYIEYVRQSLYFNRSMIDSSNNAAMMQTFDSHRDKTFRMAIVNWKLNPGERHFTANDINTRIYESILDKNYDQIKVILDEYTAYNRERFITRGTF